MSDDKNMKLNDEQMEQATGGTGHAVAPSVAEDRMGGHAVAPSVAEDRMGGHAVAPSVVEDRMAGHAVAPSVGVDPMGREVAPLKPVTDAVASHR